MLDTREEKCHAIIHTASAATGGIGAGLAQIPLADSIPITGIQVGMIISIGQIFDVKLTESVAKGLLTSFSAGVVGRNIAGIAFGWVPIVGNTFKATTAAALTEAIGWAAVKHFEDSEKEKEDVFKNGTKAGEAKVKEKANDILKEIKERDYFIFSLLEAIYYINNNEIDMETREYLQNIMSGLNSKTERRVNEKIQKIIISENNLENYTIYIKKLNVESLKKLENILYEIGNINVNIKKDIKLMECLKIIRNI